MSARSRLAGLGRTTTRRVRDQSAQTTRKAKRGARKVERTAERKVANPWLERSARLGYVVRGVLYAVMGILALGLALGGFTQPTDQRGSLTLIRGSSLQQALLVVAVVGLAGYSAWGFIRAIFDPLHRGSDPTGIAARLGLHGAVSATRVCCCSPSSSCWGRRKATAPTPSRGPWPA